MHLHTLIVAFLVLPLVGGCTGRDSASQELVVTGSTTILPIAEIAAEQFMDTNEDVKVLVSGVGSSAGIEAVAAGTSHIGTASRDLKPEEGDLHLVDTPIAFDGIAVIVNPNNRIDGLTVAQLQDVFSGKVHNWREVGGTDTPIDLVNRDEASGTREAFKKLVMGDDVPFDRAAAVLPGTGQVRDVVSRSEGAVGYISVGFIKPRYAARRVKALKVDGVAPTSATVADGTYPIRRQLHFFTKGEPKGMVAEYIEFVLSDAVQQGVVTDAGFIPVSSVREETP